MGTLDYDQVAPRLFQGGAVDPTRSYHPFSMIVLCAEELQPTLPRFTGTILRPAFRDTPNPTAAEIRRARAAAQEVAAHVKRGGRVLVTCAAGLNRSGLVVGLALNRLTDWSPEKIVRQIRRARGDDALYNPTFRQIVAACNRGQGCIVC